MKTLPETVAQAIYRLADQFARQKSVGTHVFIEDLQRDLSKVVADAVKKYRPAFDNESAAKVKCVVRERKLKRDGHVAWGCEVRRGKTVLFSARPGYSNSQSLVKDMELAVQAMIGWLDQNADQ